MIGVRYGVPAKFVPEIDYDFHAESVAVDEILRCGSIGYVFNYDAPRRHETKERHIKREIVYRAKPLESVVREYREPEHVRLERERAARTAAEEARRKELFERFSAARVQHPCLHYKEIATQINIPNWLAYEFEVELKAD